MQNKKDIRRRNKKHAERTMSELGKPVLKKSDNEKKTENQCQNAARENNKP